MCSFVYLGFPKRVLCPDIVIHKMLKLRHHIGTETYRRLPWQFCNFIMWNYELMLKFHSKIKSNSSPIKLFTFQCPINDALWFNNDIFCHDKRVLHCNISIMLCKWATAFILMRLGWLLSRGVREWVPPSCFPPPPPPNRPLFVKERVLHLKWYPF